MADLARTLDKKNQRQGSVLFERGIARSFVICLHGPEDVFRTKRSCRGDSSIRDHALTIGGFLRSARPQASVKLRFTGLCVI